MFRFYVIYLFFYTSNAAKILAYFGTPSLSHQVTYQPIWRELALRGHNVTVITPNPLKDNSIKNLKEIDIHDISYEIWNRHNISTLGVNGEEESKGLYAFLAPVFEIMEAHLEHPEFKALIKNEKNEEFDLIFVEYMVPVAFPLKFIYNCPMVGILSMPPPDVASTSLGNPSNPIINPDVNLPFGKNLNFMERFISVVFYLMTPLILSPYAQQITNILEKSYGNMPFYKMHENIDMMFVNMNPVLQNPRANQPNFIEFNGIHITEPKPLPKDLKEWLDQSKEGVIYVSFGSNIKSSLLPEHKQKLLLDTFKDLPYKILWKFEKDELSNKPDNVEIRKWVLQLDVLRHPNVKLFVTQGGLQSLDEAMYTKTPVVVIPFFGDQHGNARKIEDIGIGKSIKFTSLTSENFKDAILHVINDPSYLKKASEVYNILTDKPVQPLEQIVWWIEYVIRHKGAEHLKNPGIRMSFYEYYMLDIIALILVIIAVLLFIIIKLCKLIYTFAHKIILKNTLLKNKKYN